jgi:hypothetical protein
MALRAVCTNSIRLTQQAHPHADLEYVNNSFESTGNYSTYSSME